MDKYAIQDEDLVEGLRNEEHDLMMKVSKYMHLQDKTAQEDTDFRTTQARLLNVRNKITEHDLKKFSGNG